MINVVEEGVYFLFDKGELVYIGESDNLFRRIGQHIYEKRKVFDAFEIYPCADRKRLEGFLIRLLHPKYNISEGKSEWTSRMKDDIFPSQTIKEAISIYENHYDAYTVGEVAEILGTYHSSVMHAISKHGEEIPVWKVDGRWKIERGWVDKNKDALWEMIND